MRRVVRGFCCDLCCVRFERKRKLVVTVVLLAALAVAIAVVAFKH